VSKIVWPECMPENVWLPGSLNPLRHEPEREYFHKEKSCRLLASWGHMFQPTYRMSLPVWPCPVCFESDEYEELSQAVRVWFNTNYLLFAKDW
jgi:hypothetical protein